MLKTEKSLKLPSLREALEQLGNTPKGQPDIVAACMIAGGAPAEEVSEDIHSGWWNTGEKGDALLALHALANVYHEATPRIEALPEWQSYRDDTDAEQFSLDIWCQVMTGLMTSQEFGEWIAEADRHLDTARAAKYEILPALAREYRGEKLLAMTVAQCANQHYLKHGQPADGDFALTIAEAFRQFNGKPL